MLVRSFLHLWPCLKSPLSRSDDTPSGWYSFPVDILLVRCRPSNSFSHLRCPVSLLFPSHISSVAVSIHIVPHILRRACLLLSSPLNLSAIPIILHLHRVFVVILLYLCCGPYHIIFRRSVYFAAVVCLPSPIGSSPCYALFCTTLLAPLWSTIIFSLSALIISLHFSLFFWKYYLLSPWCSLSARICRIFSPLALTLFCSNLIITLSSICSDLLALSPICSILISPLVLWSSCSN